MAQTETDLNRETIEVQVQDLHELFSAQREAVDLEVYDLRRRYFAQPATVRVTFGSGNAAEQTIPGDQKDAFNGAAILNNSAKIIYFGLAAGSSIGSALFCPPYSGIVFPGRYSELSLSVSNADAQAAPSDVAVVRLRVAPLAPAVFGYGAGAQSMVAIAGTVDVADRAARALGAVSAAAGSTWDVSDRIGRILGQVRTQPNTAGGTSTAVAVGVASTAVLAGNVNRKRAIIVNDSANVIYLNVIGAAAVLNAGIRLNPGGGSYDDQGATQQAIAGISSVAASNVTVTELV